MPKKRQDKALLIKPGASSATSRSPKPSSRHDETSTPSVNDLIRESRRLQIRNEPFVSPTAASSLPPAVREVLSLPTPPSPAPRAGMRAAGPSRLRRIPGPPPPRSWLTDSIHAPVDLRKSSQYERKRLQKRTSNLPEGCFPDTKSLQHLVMKEMAIHWDWHMEYDNAYLATLPITIKESLLSYIAVYCDDLRSNPLRLLFLSDEDSESRDEVTRLDLSGAIGTWTSLRQLAKDLSPAKDLTLSEHATEDVLETWETSEIEYTELAAPTQLGVFKNLRHLSLALSPTISASWKDLIRLAEKLPTISSLSLAYWSQPTYTPRAASTRALVKPAGSIPGIVYGGSNFYTAFDNDWREAAGILRSLSKALYCLKWLDLTGCGEWFGALIWKSNENMGPEWNGSWRGVDHICLDVGWTPVAPDLKFSEEIEDLEHWNIEMERQKYRYRKEVDEYRAIRRTALGVAQQLRVVRKAQAGKWIEADLGRDEL